VRTLQFPARVATAWRVDIGSTVTGRVAQVAVNEGTMVRQGNVLARLEGDELRATVHQARGRRAAGGGAPGVLEGQARLGPGEGIIGRKLADDLDVHVGDRITGSIATASDSLRITALVDMGVRELNRRTLIAALRAAHRTVGLPGGATRLDLALVGVWQAQSVADGLSRRLPCKVHAGNRPMPNRCRC
jgi:multidrug efflux pump subunit AcrA (membrane-fusion protein)